MRDNIHNKKDVSHACSLQLNNSGNIHVATLGAVQQQADEEPNVSSEVCTGKKPARCLHPTHQAASSSTHTLFSFLVISSVYRC